MELNEKDKRTFGERLADSVAKFGGSWTFILSFTSFLVIWIIINVYFLNEKGFDPYPFILLNLILSCVAALQAPIIMMSQNRQEQKDRHRAKKDFIVNKKSELEIRNLQDKMELQQKELLENIEKQKQLLQKLLDYHEKQNPKS
jgi:uncharacterized membrane protein